MERPQPCQAAEAATARLRAREQCSSIPLFLPPFFLPSLSWGWSSLPRRREATDVFLTELLMQIMVMENSSIWLKINLSALHQAVLLCVKELTVNMVI